MKKKWNPIIAICVCFCMVMNIFTSVAEASVQVIEEEELAAPTNYPVEGYIHTKIIKSKEVYDQTKVTYNAKEVFLPILVGSKEQVYCQLTTLAEAMGLIVDYSNSSAVVILNESKLLMTIESFDYYYTNDLFSNKITLTEAPLIYQDEWYVPLDYFLNLTGTVACYGAKDVLDKQILTILPPQRTLLDDMMAFYRDAYREHVFDYAELGYTEEVIDKMANAADLAQYAYNIGSLDLRTWLSNVLYIDSFSEEAKEYRSVKWLDNYLENVLTLNEEIEELLGEGVKNTLDAYSVLSEVWEEASTELKKVPESDGAQAVFAVEKKSQEIFSYLEKHGIVLQNKMKTIYKGVNAGADLAPFLLDLYLCYQHYAKDGDDDDIAAVKAFYEERNSLDKLFLTSEEYKEIKTKIDYYEIAAKGAVNDFFRKNVMDLGLAVAKLFEVTVAGEVLLAANIWEGGVKLLFSDGLNMTESFLTGLVGISYQRDAVNVAIASYEKSKTEMLTGEWTEEKGEHLCSLFFHAAKSCYVARYAGCAGGKVVLDNHPQIRKQEENKNRYLSELCARFKNMKLTFGMTPDSLKCVDKKREHKENLIFGIVELEGQVFKQENGKPAKFIEIEITGKNGALLAKTITDKNGWFRQALVLNDLKPADFLKEDENPLCRELTIRLYYKRHPVILESITVSCFRKYEIIGLQVGNKKEEKMAYLLDAWDENGDTILKVQEFELPEDTLSIEVPSYSDRTVMTYAPYEGETIMLNPSCLLLPKGKSMETLYSWMLPDGSWEEAFLTGMMAELDTQIPEGAITGELQNASEVREFVTSYFEVNREYPVYKITIVNSLIKKMEPIVIT